MSETVETVGAEYLDAFGDARDALLALRNNDGDSYDPCGDTERRVKAEFSAAVTRLALATKALLEVVK